MASAIDRRYRYAYKPALFLACLVPLAWAAGGVLGLPVPTLGADPVRKVLGIFGHSALNLLLITLCVTPFRYITGNANLLRLRRMLGVSAFSYALLHFLTYLGPYQAFMWQVILHDVMKRPYITIGFAALLLLTPLAITSTNAMMRRLKRRWQSLHRLIYVIATLGVWHYWWQTKSDIHEPLLYAVILATLLGWRLWRRQHKATSKSALPRVPETA
ncbi:MAG TPA: protein-methionine-sulfoxide reductase heme-binding subunit MsrQ [Steroidobacteraceae bacterium]|nr:protein-methionine-sulfoxide reductase heme-binding subunit MsrQ [Steroidobacteraceae bacterium]